MFTRYLKLPVLLSTLFLFSACGGSGFDREQAETLISESDEAEKVRSRLKFSNRGFTKGVNGFAWNNEGELTTFGEKKFSNVSRSSANLKNPAKINIDITGILSSEKSKQVEFTWEYRDLSTELKQYATTGGEGKAVARKYDDGWRMQDVGFNSNGGPYSLSGSESEKWRNVLESRAEHYRNLLQDSEDRDSELIESMGSSCSLATYFRNTIRNEIDRVELRETGINFDISGQGSFMKYWSSDQFFLLYKDIETIEVDNESVRIFSRQIEPADDLHIGLCDEYREKTNKIKQAKSQWERKYGEAYWFRDRLK